MFKLSMVVVVVANIVMMNVIALAVYVGEKERQFTEEVDT